MQDGARHADQCARSTLVYGLRQLTFDLKRCLLFFGNAYACKMVEASAEHERGLV